MLQQKHLNFILKQLIIADFYFSDDSKTFIFYLYFEAHQLTLDNQQKILNFRNSYHESKFLKIIFNGNSHESFENVLKRSIGKSKL